MSLRWYRRSFAGRLSRLGELLDSLAVHEWCDETGIVFDVEVFDDGVAEVIFASAEQMMLFKLRWM